MINAEETKRRKARDLRYRKPIVKNINLDFIKQDLYDIVGECDNVRYFFEDDDETLINALDGNEDDAYEFKMMFADLSAECERMMEDLEDDWNCIPECFDLFFVGIGGSDAGGGLLGWDSYEGDYFGLQCSDGYAEEQAVEKLKRMKKEELITNATMCFRIYHAYIGIRHRYDCLKASMDILKDENTGYLQLVKQIEEVYEKANEKNFFDSISESAKPTRELERLANCMPQEAWIQ